MATSCLRCHAVSHVPDCLYWVMQLAFQRGLITANERDRVYKVMLDLGLALWDEVCTVPMLMKVRQLGVCVSLWNLVIMAC